MANQFNRVVASRDPLKARQFRTQRPESPEDLAQPLYDRVNLATTVPSSSSFFATPKGQSATLIVGTATSSKTKTYRDTNIETANVVPSKLYKFFGFSLGFVHTTQNASTNGADRNLVLQGGYLNIRFVDKDILFVPLCMIPVINPWAAIATTANATTIMGDNPGGGQGVPMYPMRIDLTLEPYTNFSVSMNFDGTLTLTGSLDMYFLFWAYQRRPT